ncbi:lysophospholipid acyltransferase family protein [Skermanella pratensis]|uniref:lysophospholipid acyltransferase family protein n=1 Tax=Skermanella pratensis TaxID=2233999 RepID=UPI0013011D9B|nr:lysophospholipid acyltransferase family protein [Skermanella pratensis]
MTAARSLLFNIAFFTWTTVCCFGLLWMLLLPRRQMVHVVEWYLRTIYFLERTILGLDYEVRGLENVPRNGSYILAAKHQSAWETMKLHLLIDDPAIILKRELLFLPIWGWYAAKARMIAVDRSARGRAIASMVEGAARIKSEGRPIVIFPQGTRTAVGRYLPYRVGVAVLYKDLDLPIVPMALNSGVYWGRRSFRKHSGRVVVEFLPPIEPGLSREAALAELESRLETATDRLVMEAGGPPTEKPAKQVPQGAPAPVP